MPARQLACVLALAVACGDAPFAGIQPSGGPQARSTARSTSRPASAPADPYLAYLKSAPELQRVRQDPALSARWDTWLYMPWRYRWEIGTGEAGGRFCRAYGINGGVLDHGRGPLEWLERWGLRFYVDHAAGKGDLFLIERKPSRRQPNDRDPAPPGQDERDDGRTFPQLAVDGRAVRPRPLDGELRGRLAKNLERNVRALRGNPLRVAYALDDEVSWGALARPLPWRVDADDGAYARWLETYYGKAGGRSAAPAPRWVTPEEVRRQLDGPLGAIDLSPLLDRMSYNDSVWANLLGDLVQRANRLDPATPCGVVGVQGPSLWGGHDYAKLMKKVQFLEAYDLGSAGEIARSLDPAGAIPRVTTHFHRPERGAGADSWLAWHHFAHGARGMIGWVEGWFDGGRPRPWLDAFAPSLRELGAVQGPKTVGARWIHDGIGIYYSHPSIQISWLLDSQPHGATWPARNRDFPLGTSHLTRRAWELLLEDAGLQYSYLSYDEVALSGVPREYRVLILPACFALSDAEARRIAEFAAAGGTVIADFACGLFDQHGRARRRGALDGLFGVAHDGTESRADFFGGKLWVETDQEAGYSYKRYRELFATAEPRLAGGPSEGPAEGPAGSYAVAERRLPAGASRAAGSGRAIYLNLSPQRYLMHRQEGRASPELRRPFLDPVLAAGASPWIRLASQGARPEGIEATYWSKNGRTLVFLTRNLEIEGGPGGGPVDLVAERLPLEVELAGEVQGAVDERTGTPLGDRGRGRRFRFDLDTTQAVFFSFAGPPPRPASRR